MRTVPKLIQHSRFRRIKQKVRELKSIKNKYFCEICGKEVFHNIDMKCHNAMTIDHITPRRIVGDTWELSNYAVLCSKCHCNKNCLERYIRNFMKDCFNFAMLYNMLKVYGLDESQKYLKCYRLRIKEYNTRICNGLDIELKIC